MLVGYSLGVDLLSLRWTRVDEQPRNRDVQRDALIRAASFQRDPWRTSASALPWLYDAREETADLFTVPRGTVYGCFTKSEA